MTPTWLRGAERDELALEEAREGGGDGGGREAEGVARAPGAEESAAVTVGVEREEREDGCGVGTEAGEPSLVQEMGVEPAEGTLCLNGYS